MSDLPPSRPRRRPVNKHKKRWRDIRYKYGIDEAEYTKMFAKQGHRCAACKDPEPASKKGWHLDHCHTTGTIRGILCYRCNTALGYAKECDKRLRNLARYIRKYR